MIWSKANKALESRLAVIRDHARFHITRYGRGVSAIMTRAWVTWDGADIAHMSSIEQVLNADTFSRWDYTDTVEDDLSLSIDNARTSTTTIVRSLAMFDRRLGVRRLKALRSASDNTIVRQFDYLRLQAEGLAEAVPE